MEGYLEKKSANPLKGFQRRWFRREGHELKYFTEPGDREPQGIVNLLDVEKVGPIADDKSSRRFDMMTKKRVWKLKADSQEDRDSWLECLVVWVHPKHVCDSVSIPRNTFNALLASINYCMDHGTEVEGLFRIPGSVAVVNDIVRLLHVHEEHFFEKSLIKNGFSVHDVASAIKKMIRELPEPILTYKLCAKILGAKSISDLRDLINDLPKRNYVVLLSLCMLCLKLSEAPETSMSPSNLGICLGRALIVQDKETAFHNFAPMFEMMINSISDVFWLEIDEDADYSKGSSFSGIAELDLEDSDSEAEVSKSITLTQTSAPEQKSSGGKKKSRIIRPSFVDGEASISTRSLGMFSEISKKSDSSKAQTLLGKTEKLIFLVSEEKAAPKFPAQSKTAAQVTAVLAEEQKECREKGMEKTNEDSNRIGVMEEKTELKNEASEQKIEIETEAAMEEKTELKNAETSEQKIQIEAEAVMEERTNEVKERIPVIEEVKTEPQIQMELELINDSGGRKCSDVIRGRKGASKSLSEVSQTSREKVAQGTILTPNRINEYRKKRIGKPSSRADFSEAALTERKRAATTTMIPEVTVSFDQDPYLSRIALQEPKLETIDSETKKETAAPLSASQWTFVDLAASGDKIRSAIGGIMSLTADSTVAEALKEVSKFADLHMEKLSSSQKYFE